MFFPAALDNPGFWTGGSLAAQRPAAVAANL